MKAWTVDQPGPIATKPLRLSEIPDPQPGPGEVRIRVSVCGVCRTDLHVAEGDLPVVRPSVVPGHEVVGEVDRCGSGTTRFRVGDRVGAAWLARTDGTCRWCRRGRENLCEAPTFTGWHVDGGYAQWCIVDERFAYALPAGIADDQAAPFLCAGIIGYRALKRSQPPAGGVLGLYGFGGSAHLTAQLALAMGLRVHVLTRGERNRQLASAIGCDSVGDAYDEPPEELDSAIVFAPAGELVPVALRAVGRGGVVATAGIWMTDVPSLSYERELFNEKELRSVTANTRSDGEEFLQLAQRLGLHATTSSYPMTNADVALADLARGAFSGAAVLHADW